MTHSPELSSRTLNVHPNVLMAQSSKKMVIVSHAYHINNLIQLKDHVRQSVPEDRCIQQTDNIVSIAQDSHDHLILIPFVMNDALLLTSS